MEGMYSAKNLLTFKANFTKIAFAANVDHDLAAQNMLPDLKSTLSAMLEDYKLGVYSYFCLVAG